MIPHVDAVYHPYSGGWHARSTPRGKILAEFYAGTKLRSAGCPVGEVINPASGLCVLRSGALGKFILDLYHPPRGTPTLSKVSNVTAHEALGVVASHAMKKTAQSRGKNTKMAQLAYQFSTLPQTSQRAAETLGMLQGMGNATRALPNAVARGNVDNVTTQLSRWADPNHAKDMETVGIVLHRAARDGHLEIVDRLLRAGAAVDAPSAAGATALHEAATHGRVQIVDRLLQAGADMNARSRYEKTALMRAARSGHLEVVGRLLRAGADMNARDYFEDTALMMAAQDGRLEVVDRLLRAGADVNARNRIGNTALMLAAQVGRLEVVDHLLRAGADVNARNRNGKTALMMAAERGRTEVADRLRQAGAA